MTLIVDKVTQVYFNYFKLYNFLITLTDPLILFLFYYFYFADANLKINLRPSNNLVDDSFAFIMRDEDAPKIYENSYKLAEKYANCFYHGENSAFDLCDGAIVSHFY